MLAGLRLAAVLAGARGQRPADLDAIADAITALSRLAVDLGLGRERSMAVREAARLSEIGKVYADADLGCTEPDALARLETVDARAAQVVTLRFYSGMSNPEIAQHLSLSLRTVEGDWTFARAWLKRELAGETHQTGE